MSRRPSRWATRSPSSGRAEVAQLDTPERLLGAPADGYVENFLGFDRGIRRLSFLAASGLSLDDRAVVGEDVPPRGGRLRPPRPGRTGAGHRRRAQPLGWAAASDLEALPSGSRAGQARLEPYGHTFDVRTDSLRAALDATVLSPTGQAVGVDDDGRVVGVTSYERLRVAIHAADQGGASGRSGRERAADAGGAPRGRRPMGAAAEEPPRREGPVAMDWSAVPRFSGRAPTWGSSPR